MHFDSSYIPRAQLADDWVYSGDARVILKFLMGFVQITRVTMEANGLAPGCYGEHTASAAAAGVVSK